MLDYTAQYVPTHLNIADGPSRDDVAHLESIGASENTDWVFPDFSGGFGSWMSSVDQVGRAVL